MDQYARDQGVSVTEIIPQATNPPLLLWLLRPLAQFPPAAAFWLFAGMELVSVALCFLVTYQLLGRQFSTGDWCLAGGIAFCSMPMFSHFWFSQFQLPLLAVVMVGAMAMRRGRPWLACVLFTLAAAVKLYPSPLALWPALAARGRQRWTLLGWTALCGLGWTALPGWTLWDSFRRHGLPLVSTMGNGDFYNFTVPALVAGLGSTSAGLALGLALICVAWWCCARRPPDSDSALCLLLVTAVICSIVAWVHYLVWLFYPLLVVATQARQAAGPRRVWLVALVLVALVVVNAAGSNPLAVTHRAAKLLNASLPLLVMGWLYVHFARPPEMKR